MAREFTTAELRKYKYRLVRNITNDAKQARRMREWSFERISIELNREINKQPTRMIKLKVRVVKKKKVKKVKVIKPKTVTKITKPKKTKKIILDDEPETDHDELGEETAYTAGLVKKEQKKKRKLLLQEKLDELDDKYKQFTTDMFDMYENSDDKLKNWGIWSSNDYYPPLISKVAENANRLVNKQDDDSYGWAVAFYMYTEGLSMQDVFQFLKPDMTIYDGYIDVRETL